MHDGERRASLWGKVYVGLVNPILNGDAYRGLHHRLRELRLEEDLSGEKVREKQWQRLRNLLEHAYDSTPYYRRRLEEFGVKPSDVQSFDDLRKIPILSREDIRENFEELWSRRYARESLRSAATGGTTDTPVPLLRSADCLKDKLAIQTQLDSWANMWPGDKIFSLWGAQQDFPANPTFRWRFYSRYLMRRVTVPTSLLKSEILESYRVLLNEFRPKIIYAYPTPLALFCEYLQDCGRSFHRPVSAICTAEPLLAQQREVIENTLGCQVFEHYGTRDFGMVGGECEGHQGMHLHPSGVYVEFAPIQGAEIDGLHEMLVTDLLNYGMPLIRYKINDCAILATEPCKCGRGFPMVKKIVGRTTDNFYLPDGSVVPGVALTNRVIQVCPGLRKVQVIQHTTSDFHIRYVPGPDFSKSDLELLAKKLRVFFPDPVQWSFEEVTQIERERSGKTRFCISYVQNGSKQLANRSELVQ